MKRTRSRIVFTRVVAAGLIGLAATTAALHGQPPGDDQGPGGPGGGRGPGGPPNSPLMTALDTDKNGELSATEIKNASKSLKTLDKDKNGKLSAAELRPTGRGPGGRPNPEQMVARLMQNDADKDGKLSADEVPERMQNFLANADTNQDGFLDKAELTKFAQQGPGGPGGGPGGPGGPDGGGPGGPGGFGGPDGGPGGPPPDQF